MSKESNPIPPQGQPSPASTQSESGRDSDLLKNSFHKIDSDLSFLMRCFQEVLTDLGQGELAQVLPWIEDVPAASKGSRELLQLPPRTGQAYALAFQLLNMIEENTSAQVRRAREASAGTGAEDGLWGEAIQKLRDSGLSAEEMACSLGRVHVEPVLTVHPTEAKRSTVLEQHRALYLLLFERENPIWTPSEREAIADSIKTSIERLWRTGEILGSKPDIADERRNLLHYGREVFPAVLPRLDARLRSAWKQAGFNPDLLDCEGCQPRLSFGSWAGGDRDGHPFVTAEVTRETLLELRLNALLVLRRQLDALWEKMSLSSLVQSPPQEFQNALERLASGVGERAAAVIDAAEEEPWRQYVGMMIAKLPSAVTGRRLAPMPLDERLFEQPGMYRFAREVQADLQVLEDSLHAVGAERIGEMDVRPVRRALEVFGLHLTSLDVRQNSKFHDKALAQLMDKAHVQVLADVPWPEQSEQERLKYLEGELESPRPFLHAGTRVGEEADAVLDCYRVLEEHIARFEADALGALIVSMTRSLSDLLSVYVLAREAGLAVASEDGLVCALPVVPLFETEDDLVRGPGILDAFLSHPVTRRSLEMQAARTGSAPTQQVMIGYSDSNKDSGILAAQWALHQAQREMTRVGQKHGIEIRFFHGRGGTISRGAGPTHRFLESLPPGSLSGDLRMTEQGETIAQKYANLNTATYNLELLLAGTWSVAVQNDKAPHNDSPQREEVAQRLALWSRQSYRGLLGTPGFMEFYERATPIDALEHARIGSRPTRRTGTRSLEDLRAIPWVFSWNQSRFYLPGWFGIGSALKKLSIEDSAAFERLRGDVRAWPFLSYVLTNVETNLASADTELMQAYASLVEDGHLRHRFLDEIVAEWSRSREMLARIFGYGFEVRRPRMHQTLQLRARALRLLHFQQIALLRQWRDLRAQERTEEAEAMLPDLLLSINAIASGLRTTG
jgi:phosphoenolpyruvate carboxylase